MKPWLASAIAMQLCLVAGTHATLARAQTPDNATLAKQIDQLSQAVDRTQAQLEESQHQLLEMRKQLSALQAQMAQATAAGVPSSESAVSVPTTKVPNEQPQQKDLQALQKDVDDLRERQDLQQSEIATHEQAKVETASKFPVRLTGLVLFNGFVNAGGVDTPDVPTIAEAGSGSTGLSIRQTVLGFDARGPHLGSAESYADARIDFYGNPQVSTGNYSGAFYGHPNLVRLQTAHAGIRWNSTTIGFSFDKPIVSPDSPTSLTAVANPALAWSGNLWQWNPQLVAGHDFSLPGENSLQLRAALIDTQDSLMPPLSTSIYTARSLYSSLGEQSRWPGVEAHMAFAGPLTQERGSHFGVGGYVAPHLLPNGTRYNAWAATLNGQWQLPKSFEATASFYRGMGLGGLGAGTYKDFVYTPDPDHPGSYYYRPLDDVGGWVQLKKRVGQRLEFNGASGIDNAFAHELARVPVPLNYSYAYLARNRTATANVIYSPSSYLLFSLEYRHLTTASTTGAPANSNVVGAAAGYRF